MRARASITAASAATILAACGGNPAPPPQSGSGGGTSASLRLATAGDGVIDGAGSDCRGPCTVQVARGTQLQLQAIPDSGASFAGWGGACTGNSTSCLVTVDGDTSVDATFMGTGPVQAPPPAILNKYFDKRLK